MRFFANSVLSTSAEFNLGVGVVRVKLMYFVVTPFRLAQVVASLFNYVLTNSEDRRFDATQCSAVPDSECGNTSTRLFALSR
jgi:hypothetical protein